MSADDVTIHEEAIRDEKFRTWEAGWRTWYVDAKRRRKYAIDCVGDQLFRVSEYYMDGLLANASPPQSYYECKDWIYAKAREAKVRVLETHERKGK